MHLNLSPTELTLQDDQNPIVGHSGSSDRRTPQQDCKMTNRVARHGIRSPSCDGGVQAEEGKGTVAETLMENAILRQNTGDLRELVNFVHRKTQQQVRDLAIRRRDDGLVVTGRSSTYYVKQLVTQAILVSLPAVRLLNDIRVG